MAFGLIKKIEEEFKIVDWGMASEWAWKIHQKYASTVIHNCSAHYYLATSSWPTIDKRATDAPEVALQNIREESPLESNMVACQAVYVCD